MDTNIVIVLVVSVIAIIAAVLITAKVTTNRLKKNAEGTIGNAEEKAREIIDEALKTAENKKRDSWKSRKSPFVPRMNWTKKSRNAERKPSGMSAEFSRRKRTSIRKQMPSRSARQV